MSEPSPHLFPISGGGEGSPADWLAGESTKVRKVAFAPYDPSAAEPARPHMTTDRPPAQSATSGAPASPEPSIPREPRLPAAALDTPPPGSHSMLPPEGPSTAALAVELESRIEAFATAAVELAGARGRIVATTEEQLLGLAVEVAGAIVERELAADPELHHALARAALAELGQPKESALRASREAYAAITDVYGEPTVRVDGVAVEVVLDPALEGLGCIAETAEARVDGRVGERLRAVRRALEDERKRRIAEEGE